MASTDTVTNKPAYLGLLNAISLAEAQAGVELCAWAEATPSADLAAVLRLVAVRERSHGEVFARRIAELGFTVRPKTDPRAAARLAKLANPAISDLDKTPPRGAGEGDPFGEIRQRLAEGEFDPMTANLMGWYIAEEKDSERRLRAAFDCVREGAGQKASGPSGAPSADAEAIMACMTAGFARLEKAMEKLAKSRK